MQSWLPMLVAVSVGVLLWLSDVSTGIAPSPLDRENLWSGYSEVANAPTSTVQDEGGW